MPVLDIVKYPDPRLYEASTPITEVTDDLRQLVSDMVETMYATDGVGVAAVQVGYHLRLFVIDPTFAGGTKQDPAVVFINPEIIATEGEMKGEEGCLSLPGVFITVKRYAKTTVRARNMDWEEFEMTGEGLLSRAFQHEIEHLNGELIIDTLGGLRKKIALRKLKS